MTDKAQSGSQTHEQRQVLWSAPGVLLVTFALLSGLILAVEWVHSDPEDDTEAVVAVVPTTVEDALGRGDHEKVSEVSSSVSPDGEGAQQRGLVNLIKRVVPEEEEPEADTSPSVDAEPDDDDANSAATTKSPKKESTDVGVAIEDPERSLRPFFEALARTEADEPGAITRIVHWGDSTIVADLITASARRKLQKRFGDAGHGFLLFGKPWDWYVHHNVRHFGGKGFRLYRITSNTIRDHRYGLGGVTARAWGGGPWMQFGTVDDGPVGKAVSRFHLYYLAQPNGGTATISVDREVVKTVNTRAEEPTDRVATVSMTDGAHDIRVTSKGGGELRVYGVALERDSPGVVYDSLGITGIRAKTLGRFDREHFERQLTMRDPRLVILMIGTNESEFVGMNMEDYARDYREILSRIKAGAKNAGCLVAAPPDRGYRDKRGRLVTHPMIPQIIEVQQKAAADLGCAFWNTFEAMGGQGSMVAWYRHKPRLGSGDFTHFTVAGGEALGILLSDALISAYEEHKR